MRKISESPTGTPTPVFAPMKMFKALRREMKARGVLQEDVAQAIGVNRPAISRKMCGFVPWTMHDAYVIIRLLGCGPEMIPDLFPEMDVSRRPA